MQGVLGTSLCPRVAQVSKMVCQNPMERIAAKDAAQDSWQREELCTMVKAFSREQACSVEKVRSGIASRMFGKPKCKLNIIAVKAWWQEMLSCTSDGYEHIVRADEVLYTQARRPAISRQQIRSA